MPKKKFTVTFKGGDLQTVYPESSSFFLVRARIASSWRGSPHPGLLLVGVARRFGAPARIALTALLDQVTDEVDALETADPLHQLVLS